MILAENLWLHTVTGESLKLLVLIVGLSLKLTKPRTVKPKPNQLLKKLAVETDSS